MADEDNACEFEYELVLREVGDFGGLEAESDQLLETCFQDHPAYVSVFEMKRFLVIGKKGSGKTAISRQLNTAQNPMVISRCFTLGDYPWTHDEMQGTLSVPEDRRNAIAWKHFLLLQLASLVNDLDDHSLGDPDLSRSRKRVREFISDAYGSSKPKHSSVFTSSRRIWKTRTAAVDATIAQIGAEFGTIPLPPHVQEVNRTMAEHIFSLLNPGVKYFFCFDQLDDGFNSNDARYSNILTGLLLAAKDLLLAGQEYARNFCPVVLIRDDIYDLLRFPRKNQLTENYAVSLDWQVSSNDEGNSLLELIESRITGALNAEAEDVRWEDIFESREGEEEQDAPGAFRAICENTLVRPRDVIKFLNEVLVQLKSGGPHCPTRFDTRCVGSAREGFARYFLKEMKDELTGYESIPANVWSLLEEVGGESFTLAEFEAAYLGSDPSTDTRALDLIEALFDHSILGYLDERLGQGVYCWRYNYHDCSFKRAAKQFKVHPGLQVSLGLGS
ncbi:P-loop ATPase, Sll1717 family [Gordonia sputi]